MKTIASDRFARVLLLCTCIVCALFAFSLAGCAAPAGDEPAPEQEQEASGTEGALVEAELAGTITSISETELLVEATSSSSELLQGSVRVDISQLDSEAIEALGVDDSVLIIYSGQVGMSNPPYISAISIEVV